MQRILSRGEIEGLDHTLIPRLRLPEGRSVFVDRAARLRELAPDSPVSGYLSLMAHVADAQARLFTDGVTPVLSQELISRAQAHGMPPLQALGWPRDPAWRQTLFALLEHVAAAEVPPRTAEICRALAARFERDHDELESMADALLARLDAKVDASAAPFIMAALQVYWTTMASQFRLDDLPVVSPFGVCPVCGSLPVASIVRVGRQIDGCRYLSCSLCSSEWHLVRVVCSHCEDTETVAYHSIEDGADGIKAESCDKCHVYRKIFYQEKQPKTDAIADDLASLTLDVLMGEEGYSRASDNPLLWQQREE